MATLTAETKDAARALLKLLPRSSDDDAVVVARLAVQSLLLPRNRRATERLNRARLAIEGAGPIVRKRVEIIEAVIGTLTWDSGDGATRASHLLYRLAQIDPRFRSLARTHVRRLIRDLQRANASAVAIAARVSMAAGVEPTDALDRFKKTARKHQLA